MDGFPDLLAVELRLMSNDELMLRLPFRAGVGGPGFEYETMLRSRQRRLCCETVVLRFTLVSVESALKVIRYLGLGLVRLARPETFLRENGEAGLSWAENEKLFLINKHLQLTI